LTRCFIVWNDCGVGIAEDAGSNPALSTLDEPCTSRIFKTIWELKKKGRAEATLLGISKRLKQLAGETDLDDPEAVREHIANKKVSNSFKEGLAIAYNHYVTVCAYECA